MKMVKFAMASLAAAALTAPCLHAATYWVASGGNTDWNAMENWSHNLAGGGSEHIVPVNDNMYFTDDNRNLATISQDFTGKGSLHVHSGLDSKPLVIQNNGRTWRTSGKIRIDDERSWRRGVVVFRGGMFNASSMVVGSVITNSCRATLEDTAMTLSGATTLNQGRLTLGVGSTLETTCVSYGTGTNEAFLVFDGGTLRRAACSETELLRRADGLKVSVGANGGTIDTAGRSVFIASNIADATPDEPGDMNFKGGGTVCLDGTVGWTGGTTVEVGTCLLISSASKAALLDGVLGVAVPDAWLSSPGDAEIVRFVGTAGRFVNADLRKVRLASGALAPVRLSADHRAIVMKGDAASLSGAGLSAGAGSVSEIPDANTPGVVEHVATVNSNTSLSALFPASLEYGDMLVVNAGSDATLNIDKTADVCAVKFNVASGKTLTLTGGELGAAYVWVNGGKVVVQNGYTSSGMKVAELGRLLGNGTVAAAPGASRCRFKDCSGFTGTFDAGDGDSTWHVKIKGGAEINPNNGGFVCVLADATATVDPSGLTVRGTLKVKSGATFCKDESGATSSGKFQIEHGAGLDFRFTNPNVAPQLLRQPSDASMIVQ